jgi:hypothetical protein
MACEMYKLKIGDTCWAAEDYQDLSEFLSWEIDYNAVLKEDEYLTFYKRLVKCKTLKSKLIRTLYA